jgi:predicted Zn-dependent protease
MQTKLVEVREKEAVKSAINDVLSLAGVYEKIYVTERELLDSYVEECLKGDQLYAHNFLEKILQIHGCCVVVTDFDLYVEGMGSTMGYVIEGGALISIRRIRSIKDEELKEEVIKQETYHEIGHIFGIPNPDRKKKVKYLFGWHCRNVCAMMQVSWVRDWVRLVRERRRTGKIYCDLCENDLRDFFEKFEIRHNRE